MPAELQRAIDYTLVGLQKTYCLLADIIVISTGSESGHLSYVTKCLKKLNEDNLQINLQNCHFAKTENDCLGYNFTRIGVSPLEKKTAAIIAIPPPTTLKRFWPFLGSVHYLNVFIPNVAQLCQPLMPPLKKTTVSLDQNSRQTFQ